MVLSHTLPEDSVLRRHALTEMQRVLGLPPTDSVLQRHYAQLQSMNTGAAAVAAPAVPASPAVAAARPAAPKPAAAAAPAMAQPVRPAPAAPQASGGGGLIGWLKRLLGA